MARRTPTQLRAVLFNYAGDPEARAVLLAGDAEVKAFIDQLANDPRVVPGSIDMGAYEPAVVNVKPPRMLEAEVSISFGTRRKPAAKKAAKKTTVRKAKDVPSNGTLPLNLDPPGQ